ncbi:MAG TPA: amidohydrolase family protein [Sphingomicrobium sp.]|nr:amidohydrolase family protein [Sphingomicrobium sp.]
MRFLLLIVALAWGGVAVAQRAGEPVIDMHMHAFVLSEFGGELPKGCAGADGVTMNGRDPAEPFKFEALGTCKTMLTAPASDAALMADTIAVMKRHNVVAGVISGDRSVVAKWRAADPDRFIPAAHFFIDDNAPPAAYAAELEQAVRSGELRLFGEITAQYRGLSPDHPSLEPFYAMAERLDVPVGIHMGYGAPGGPYWIYPKYRAALGNPLLLEDLLVRHPKMRVYVMHAGMPMVDEIIMLMNAHPQVYVDISADNWGVPRKEFHLILKRLVDAGYGKRIMFGSDQMVWPDAISIAIASIAEAKFLTPEQKRDIFYNNAARFLRLSPEQIARHHGL